MITREQYIAAVGHEPQDDDLERANCSMVGLNHTCCGWNEERNLPVFMTPEVWQRRVQEAISTGRK